MTIKAQKYRDDMAKIYNGNLTDFNAGFHTAYLYFESQLTIAVETLEKINNVTVSNQETLQQMAELRNNTKAETEMFFQGRFGNQCNCRQAARETLAKLKEQK